MSLAIDDDIGTRLSMAYRVGLARRRSIQIPCASTGLIASIVGIYIWRRIFPFQHAGVAMVYLGNFVLTLAILPTDALSIRVGLAWSICITLIVGAFHILDVIAANEALATATQGRHDEEPFAHWESVSLFYLRFHLVRDCLYVLAWLHAAPRGLLLGCAADLTPRQRLDGIWRINGHVMLLVAVIAAMFFPIALLDGSVAERGTVYYCFYAIALAVTSLVSGFSLQPGMRARIHSHLSLHSAEMQTAAGIASLLGRHTAREISREARARFTCVTLDAVTYVHMLSPKPDQTFGIQPVHAALGDVDVFLSHSWHDEPNQKWVLLQAWRRDFVAQHGREPRVWLDKFNIDSTAVEVELSCLPVFIAGCNSLLILAGPTYLQRLWCVTELWVYLQMGGDPSRIELHVPPGFELQVDTFDARAASCVSTADRDWLLTMIEAGCRGIDQFNHSVKVALTMALEANKPSGERRAGSMRPARMYHPSPAAVMPGDTSDPVNVTTAAGLAGGAVGRDAPRNENEADRHDAGEPQQIMSVQPRPAAAVVVLPPGRA